LAIKHLSFLNNTKHPHKFDTCARLADVTSGPSLSDENRPHGRAWALQPGTDPQRAQLIWFIRAGDYPQATELAQLARERLAGLDGLDHVPAEWLHMTTLIAGYADETAAAQVQAMTDRAQTLLAAVPPITVTFGRVLYHPRAIILAAEPREALTPVLTACQQATRQATGHDGTFHTDPWIPHLTLAYSNTAHPAQPAIDALGRQLPSRQVTITSVSLTSQTPDQRYTWDLIADATLDTRTHVR
jgi:2'-5' RNA ligase